MLEMSVFHLMLRENAGLHFLIWQMSWIELLYFINCYKEHLGNKGTSAQTRIHIHITMSIKLY